MKIESVQIIHIKPVHDFILRILKRLVKSEMWESNFLSHFSQSLFFTECEQTQIFSSRIDDAEKESPFPHLSPYGGSRTRRGIWEPYSWGEMLTWMIILRRKSRCNAEYGVDQQTKAVILAPD